MHSDVTEVGRKVVSKNKILWGSSVIFPRFPFECIKVFLKLLFQPVGLLIICVKMSMFPIRCEHGTFSMHIHFFL